LNRQVRKERNEISLIVTFPFSASPRPLCYFPAVSVKLKEESKGAIYEYDTSTQMIPL